MPPRQASFNFSSFLSSTLSSSSSSSNSSPCSSPSFLSFCPSSFSTSSPSSYFTSSSSHSISSASFSSPFSSSISSPSFAASPSSSSCKLSTSSTFPPCSCSTSSTSSSISSSTFSSTSSSSLSSLASSTCPRSSSSSSPSSSSSFSSSFFSSIVCPRPPSLPSLLLLLLPLLLVLVVSPAPALSLPDNGTAAAAAAPVDDDGGGSGSPSPSPSPSAAEEGDDDAAWWANALDVESSSLDGASAAWTALAFVPPPPRPHFLDGEGSGAAAPQPDGLTTCDLCSWATQRRLLLPPSAAGDGDGDDRAPHAADRPGSIGWALTLAIVSILSAAIGAVIMVTVLQCRNRLKNDGSAGLCSLCIRSPNPAASSAANAQERAQHDEGDKHVMAAFENRDGGGRVWTWLANRRGPPQLTSQPPSAPAENHYTLDEAYTAVGEALYAELDRESSSSPAYQNTAYNGSDTDPDPDGPTSSAPSSAYYSDLSCATAPDRTYEAVGLAINSNSGNNWENGDTALRRHPVPRLAAITETITVPSDYV